EIRDRPEGTAGDLPFVRSYRKPGEAGRECRRPEALRPGGGRDPPATVREVWRATEEVTCPSPCDTFRRGPSGECRFLQGMGPRRPRDPGRVRSTRQSRERDPGRGAPPTPTDPGGASGDGSFVGGAPAPTPESRTEESPSSWPRGRGRRPRSRCRSEEHTSELQSRFDL